PRGGERRGRCGQAHRPRCSVPYASPFACRNCRATSAGDCLAIATAAFICCIALVVSTLLTAFSVSANAGPSAASTLVETIGVTFWKPKTFFGSSSTTYLPPC